ncbi:protein of unknown function [Aminobacter niigataensis]|nr:protein of unknown function [Aminobacter niigataensis]
MTLLLLETHMPPRGFRLCQSAFMPGRYKLP